MAYIQKNHPYPVTSCGRRRTFMQGGDPGDDRTKAGPFQKKNAQGKEQGVDGKACWDGYKYAGTEGGSDKCAPIGKK